MPFCICVGFVVGSTIIIAQSIVADVYPEEERGTAMGRVLAPMLLGPIIAPIIGGVLSQAFGWRSNFMFLALLNVLVVICVLFVPETNHWHIRHKFINNNTDSNIDITTKEVYPIEILMENDDLNFHATNSNTNLLTDEEAANPTPTSYPIPVLPSQLNSNNTLETYDTEAIEPGPSTDTTHTLTNTTVNIKNENTNDNTNTNDGNSILPIYTTSYENVDKTNNNDSSNNDEITKPVFIYPWEVLSLLFDKDLIHVYILNFFSFGVMFMSLTLLPVYLAREPYNLSESVIGVTYLPIG